MAAVLADDGSWLYPVRGCGLLITPHRFTDTVQDPD